MRLPPRSAKLSSAPRMLAVLLASPASSAGVHEAEIEGAQGRRVAVTNVLPSCDGKRASDTHGALMQLS